MNAPYIGLMSGTSMDGVDAVLARIGDASAEVLARHEEPFPRELHARLERALDTPALTAHEFWCLDALLGELFARAALGALAAASLDASHVAAIGCHGQTLYHAPKGAPPLTVQAGDANIVAARTGITTVADFRRRDLALGGEGAPLAPAFHRAVFHSSHEARCIVNIGGIANLSVLDRDPDAPVIGFDSGPGNTLLDQWCARHTGAAYDRGGAWARSGQVVPALLEAMQAESFFSRAPPKSTGRERFNMAWLDARLEAAPGIAPADVQRTLVELTARTIAAAARGSEADAVYVCGGGAMNATLMRALHDAVGNVKLDTTESIGIAPKDVEGVAFGWLARRSLAGEPGNRPEVTGASMPAVLGAIHPGTARATRPAAHAAIRR